LIQPRAGLDHASAERPTHLAGHAGFIDIVSRSTLSPRLISRLHMSINERVLGDAGVPDPGSDIRRCASAVQESQMYALRPATSFET